MKQLTEDQFLKYKADIKNMMDYRGVTFKEAFEIVKRKAKTK